MKHGFLGALMKSRFPNLRNSSISATTGRVRIESSANTELFIGTDGLIRAGNDVKTFATNDFLVNTDNEIHFNTTGKVLTSVLTALTTFKNVGVNQEQSIMKRVPTVEPYAEHENKKAETDAGHTDREATDTRNIT